MKEIIAAGGALNHIDDLRVQIKTLQKENEDLKKQIENLEIERDHNRCLTESLRDQLIVLQPWTEIRPGGTT